jgi:uncharacterized protein YgiM (DUF1202 family)
MERWKMKNFWICVIFLTIVIGGVGGYIFIKNTTEKKRLEEIKKGWYIEIDHDSEINVRKEPNAKSESLGLVKNGEIFKVIDINYDNKIYYWYKIEYGKNEGWVASGRKKHWVKDVNNPNDIATPEIKFYDAVYRVPTIDDINYKHLEVIEDTDKYTITHIVYHEVKPSEFIDQYWILYTITDGAGKSSSKMQKIEFDEKPDESKVEDFAQYKR